ncbi:MAG: DUF4145 domain-containing protein [Roseiarcus sp.]
MTDVNAFLKSLANEDITVSERAVYVLWWHSRNDHGTSRTPKEICDAMEDAGYARPNVTHLRRALENDPRTAKASNGRFRIKVNKRMALDSVLNGKVSDAPPPLSNTVVDMALLTKARPYNQRVAAQVNAAYDTRLFDCSAVMCRRLIESLIIDAYEHAQRDGDIKGADGNFMMLNGLVSKIESLNILNISRNAVAALKNIKVLGDLSAHSRRYNAKASDIEPLRHDLRVAAEELLHLSGQS